MASSDSTPSPAGISRADPELKEGWRRFWRYSRALIAPVLIWLLVVGALIAPVIDWLHSEDRYDRGAIQEWLEEARNADATLAELSEEYDQRSREFLQVRTELDALRKEAARAAHEDQVFLRYLDARERLAVKREEIYQHMRALGEPATKMYPGLLPLFPMIYRLEVRFSPTASAVGVSDGEPRLDAPVVWDSGLPAASGQYREAEFPLRKGATVQVHYQLRAWNKRQRAEQQKAQRLRQLGLLGVAATILGLAWLSLLQSDEREQQRQRRLDRERISQAEHQRLEEERRRVETERELLEQRLATQAAERQALELKSHLYASIGIMAGSYAHNIKNLLVRPNDLLRRCLEVEGVSPDQQHMLREVQQTLGTVTERLQQILHTVRRDPTQAEVRAIDLNVVVGALGQTWKDLAADRWHIELAVELQSAPLWISGDLSHLQQAIENLLFNARDATFEMRNQQRDKARRATDMDPATRRQALIQAAAWRGRVVLRTRSEKTDSGPRAVLEVIDNGAGMTEEVRQRCTETHFTTKRDNALYEGHSTGMGLGLSFVVTILEHHRGQLEIDSKPLAGTTFRLRMPAIAYPDPPGHDRERP